MNQFWQKTGIGFHIKILIPNKVIDRLLNKPKIVKFGLVVLEIYSILSTAVFFLTHCIHTPEGLLENFIIYINFHNIS